MKGPWLLRRLKRVLSQLPPNQASYKGNVQRDVLRAAANAGVTQTMPQPYMVTIVAKGGAEREFGVYLPHEAFKMLVDAEGQAEFCLTEDREMPKG